MGQPGMPGSQFPGEDAQGREIRDLKRAVQQFAAANVLATAGISTATGGVLVNGFMEYKREDGTRGVRVDPVTGAFTAYDATGTAEVARFGALQNTAPGEYGVEVLVGATWVQVGAQTGTWDNLAGRPGTVGGATIDGGFITGTVPAASNSARAETADGPTPEAYARVVAGIPGEWHATYMHSNGDFGRGSSNKKYKKNIHPYRLTTAQLLALRLVKYDRRSVNPKTGSIADEFTPAVAVDEVGLLAGEVEAIAPALVDYYDGVADDVKYALLGPVLLPFVQDHERAITELRAKNTQQAADIAALQQAIRDLGGNV